MANKHRELMEEMLKLAGVPLSEQEDEDQEEMPAAEQPEPEAEVEKETDDADQDSTEELSDEWEITISTGSKLKVEWHNTYLYVYYKNKRSEKISIPSKLRQNSKLVSNLFHKILSHVERVS